MTSPLDRREFLGAAAGVTLGTTALASRAGNKIVMGVMGTGGRGTGLAQAFARLQDVEIAYVCDADRNRAENAAKAVEKVAKKAPKAVQDFRKVLDDTAVDALVVATCNHWHAPGAILACAAGKHVYVEKPCSHNPREGELLVKAARNHKKHVQMGNQRRSWSKVIEAADEVRKGVIGRAYFAQSWYVSDRPTIGKGVEKAVPEGLDYDLWQGPAPRKAFRSNYLHYNWHWFWHWGNGELGNNGIHMIDLCRWGLGVGFPIRVTSSGGRYRFQDDQETPDTHIVHYEFADRKSITWQGHSCNNLPKGLLNADLMFLGDKGSLSIHGNSYTVYDPAGKEVRTESAPSSDATHLNNFLDAIRAGKTLNSEIEEGARSTLLCHLGNIAHRTGRSLRCSPENGHILDDKEAMQLWSREYEKGWEPKV